MRTYTTSDGTVYDLTNLSSAEQAYFEKCHAAYLNKVPWAEFAQLTFAAENPVLENGRLTRTGVEHPLFLAILDMETRLGAREGHFKVTPDDDIWSDPLEDEFLTIVAAAEERGVTRQTIYNALEAGELVGQPGRPSAVSRNSLKRWQVNEKRQGAGRLARSA